MIFISDAPKRLTNLDDHGLDLDDAGECDWDKAVVFSSYPGKRGEPRFRAIVPFREDLLAVVFAPLGTEAVAVISMRRASRRGRRAYEKR